MFHCGRDIHILLTGHNGSSYRLFHFYLQTQGLKQGCQARFGPGLYIGLGGPDLASGLIFDTPGLKQFQMRFKLDIN